MDVCLPIFTLTFNVLDTKMPPKTKPPPTTTRATTTVTKQKQKQKQTRQQRLARKIEHVNYKLKTMM